MPKPILSGLVVLLLSAVMPTLTQAADPAPASAPTAVAAETSSNTNTTTPTQAPPTETTSKLSKDLISRLKPDSKIVDLANGDGSCQALFIAASGKQQYGAILLLTDQEQHPDWPGPIKTLRQHLPAHGWATLAIALPGPSATVKPAEAAVPAPAPSTSASPTSPAPNTVAGANQEQTPPVLNATTTPALSDQEEKNRIVSQTESRLTAGLDYLKQQGYRNNVVLAVGDGAQFASLVLKKQGAGAAQGFIALAPWSLLVNDQTEIAESFTDLTLPVLELLPSQWPEPRQQERKLLAEKKQRLQYNQVKLQDSVLDLNSSQQLLPRIRGWLKQFVQQETSTAQPADNRASSSAKRSGVPTSSQPPK